MLPHIKISARRRIGPQRTSLPLRANGQLTCVSRSPLIHLRLSSATGDDLLTQKNSVMSIRIEEGPTHWCNPRILAILLTEESLLWSRVKTLIKVQLLKDWIKGTKELPCSWAD
jgi:hypothetical protein